MGIARADKLTDIKVGGTTVKSFGYDAAGWTTGITYSGTTTTLAYDYEGRVTSITRSGSTTNSFTYNGLNARMTRTHTNGSRTMLRDGADVLAPVVGGPARRGLRLPLRGLGGGFSPRAAPSPLPLSLGGRGVNGMEYAPGLYQWDSGSGSKPFVTDRLGSVTKIKARELSPASKSFWGRDLDDLLLAERSISSSGLP